LRTVLLAIGRMIAWLNAISSFLSLLSTVCFFIGSLGGSDEVDIVEKANWFSVENSQFQLYSNFRKYIMVDPEGQYSDMYYDDDACTVAYCVPCADFGMALFPLITVATAASFYTFGATFIGAHYPSTLLSMRGFVASSMATLLALFGWGFFMNKCYLQFYDLYKEDLSYGPGSVASLVGYLAMFAVVLMQLTGLLLGRDEKAREKVFVEPDPEPEDDA
jgi:hypothetical protein